VAIGATAVQFAWRAVSALVYGTSGPATPLIGYAVVLSTLGINLFVAIYESRRARALHSEFLAADASHTASDVVVTGAVLAAYTGARMGVTWADPVGALVVVLFIGRIAWVVISRNLGVLVDQAAIDPERICAIAGQVPGVHGCHKVRSRGTASHVQVDLHVQVDGGLTLTAAHDIAHHVEDAIRARCRRSST
jgi:cation diffusion facilitator family transporter